MAVARFYFDNTYYYIESEKVNVFPCAYRDHGIDPEARLNSEKSLTTVNGSGGGNKNYISILKGNLSLASIILVLEGYTFRLTDIDFSSFPANSTIYALIKTETYYVTSTKKSDKLGSLYVAPTGENTATSNEVLDRAFDNVKYFTGLGFSLTKPENVSYIKIYENDKLVNRNVLPINITNGKTNGSIVLNSVPNSNDETATGGVNLADGEYSIASGYGTTAHGDYSVATGQHTAAYGKCSHTEGYTTHTGDSEDSTKGTYAHAEGKETTAYGEASHAEGWMSEANGDYSHAENEENYAEGKNSHAEGNQTHASGECSHTEGEATEAHGASSHAEGKNNKAFGEASHTEGYNTQTGDSEDSTKGAYAHAEGKETLASNECSHAEGEATEASGARSHAEGKETTAYGEASHAEGNYTIAYGQSSHVEGEGNSSASFASISNATQNPSEPIYAIVGTNRQATIQNFFIGQIVTLDRNKEIKAKVININTNNYTFTLDKPLSDTLLENASLNKVVGIASGTNSHAEGHNTAASGNYSHAEGQYTTASGDSSHAEGRQTTASGSYSHAEGDHTVAKVSCQHVFGKYNADKSGTIEIAGYGDSSTRKNIRVLDTSGNEWLRGGLYLGDTANALGSSFSSRLYVNGSSYTNGNAGMVGGYVDHPSWNGAHTFTIYPNNSGESSIRYARYSRSSSNTPEIQTDSWIVGINAGGTSNTFGFWVDGLSTGGASQKACITTDGQIQASSFYATSDRRLKENLIEYKSEKSVLDLPIYKYDFINGSKNNIGCIAQDLQKICPEIVRENDNGYLSIDESKIVYLLLDEVKKLKLEVEELKNGKHK